MRSPLTEPGVKVNEGDYLIAVNGRPLRAPQNPYELFVNTANENVTLTVNSKPSEDGSHTVQVKPLADEFNLRELAWIESNRKKVDAATNGRVGYVYLPDMGGEGLNQFVKQYFPQIRKEGMIIDVRYNGGGFVDQLIFDRLRRVWRGWARTATGRATPSPRWFSTAPWPASPTTTPHPTATYSATTLSITSWDRSSANEPGAASAAFAATFR